MSTTSSNGLVSVGNSSSAVSRVIERSLRIREVEQLLSTSLTTTSHSAAAIAMVSSPDKYLPLKRRRDCDNSSVCSHGINSISNSFEEGLLVISKFQIQNEFQSSLNNNSISAATTTTLVTDHETTLKQPKLLSDANKNHQDHPNTLDIKATLSTASLTNNASIMEIDEDEEEEDIFSNLPSTPRHSKDQNSVCPTQSTPSPNKSNPAGSSLTLTLPSPSFLPPSPFSAYVRVNINTNHNATSNTAACTSLSRLTRQVVANNRGAPVAPPRTYNRVQVHVYDLIHRETVLETPWCDFPIGQCFNTLNDGMHCLGTGAYHAGIEVNGLEYAFGSNPVQGQSGVFICPPKQSPGYQYRTTLDLGQLETTRRQWILVPINISTTESSTTMLDANTITTNTAANADSSFTSLDDSVDETESLHARSETCLSPPTAAITRKRWVKQQQPQPTAITSLSPQQQQGNVTYQYREVKSFVDGKVILKEMAKEYMGVDYDILRKNCCTFVKDACLRLGATEDSIPKWFTNLAETGVLTEDAVNTVDGYVFSPIRRILAEHCSEEELKVKVILADSTHLNTTHSQDFVAPGGFEIIALSSPCANDSNGDYGGLRSVLVEEITQLRDFSAANDGNTIGIRTTVSWAY
jgi:hypothetical protein